jgi:hypothetical protein
MIRFFVPFLFAWVVASTAVAQTPAPATPEAVSAVFACAQVQSDEERLTCYDRAVGNMQRAQTEGDLVAVDREQIQTIQRESFGFSLPSVGRLLPDFGRRDGESFDELEMRIVSVIERANGRYAFEMENGQTWVQVDAQRVYNVREGDVITVRRAALGSYMLSPSRGGAAHRVRREG